MPALPGLRTITVAALGNPNAGKSTLFTALTGVHTRIGNFPGVTVEKKIGWYERDQVQVQLVDLPGTYSLSPRTLDEMVTVDVLLGRQPDVGPIDVVLCIADASNLERHLYLVGQVLDLGLPVVVVLNMWDVAQSRGIQIDVPELSRRLGVPVIPCAAHQHWNLDAVRVALQTASVDRVASPTGVFPEQFYDEVRALRTMLPAELAGTLPEPLVQRLLLDAGGAIEKTEGAASLALELGAARERLKGAGFKIPSGEARLRYAWAQRMLAGVVTVPQVRGMTASDRIDRWLTHQIAGLLAFAVIMFIVFQSIYSGAQPLMGAIESAQGWIGDRVAGLLSPGPLQSLIVDGVIAGVGGVVVFLPQIMLLFFFIAVLEDCGYMARAAFLMDKLMTGVGLSGKSFVPLMSSFACAIPGIMATRVIENWKDRFTTILVAPLMSCSARLPVYLLLIGAFIPPIWLGGWLPLQGTVLFAMTFLGAVVAIPVAWTLKKTLFRGETPPFVMELPEYKWPSPSIVFGRVYDRSKAFLLRAGTLIFATNILIWAASYFPASHAHEHELQALVEADPSEANVARLNAESERLLAGSYLGRAGKWIEPVVRPLGWDWRIGVGVIASFPAREVIVSTLGTIYSLGGDVGEDDDRLRTALRSATWPDGRPIFTIPVAVSVMVFFALCAQCAATLMVIRRETNHWGWAIFTFVYMTTLAYLGAWLTVTVGCWWSA